eukprot:SM000283S10692  [mRNA]  locus=s283:141058:142452:+ [translate_table: standard]
MASPLVVRSSFWGLRPLAGAAAAAPKAGRALGKRPGAAVVFAKEQAVAVETPDAEDDRFRLSNLSPQPGSRRKNKRKGRGIAAGQGASCGFGMRGQKSRSGSGVRPGFEGGQMPLYRRLPKLKGIAGGMGAGLPKYVSVNLEDIAAFGVEEDEEITLESLIAKRIINPSGRDRKLPLKILGAGDLGTKATIKAASFSTSAKQKLEEAGCTLVTLPGRKKFMGAFATRRAERAEQHFAAKGGDAPS